MTTNNRLSRFDNSKIESIENSGSINNQYLSDNGTLRSNIESSDPNKALTSFSVKFSKFSNKKIEELFDVEFTEFVKDDTANETQELSPFTQDQIAFLENRLNQLTSDVEEAGDAVSLSSSQKDLIIELRILLGQGKDETDFSKDFPYNPWPEYIREINQPRESSQRQISPRQTTVFADPRYRGPDRSSPTSERSDSRRQTTIRPRQTSVLSSERYLGPFPISNNLRPISTNPTKRFSPDEEDMKDIEFVGPIASDDIEPTVEETPTITDNTLIMSEPDNRDIISYDDNNNIVDNNKSIRLPSDKIVNSRKIRVLQESDR